MKPQAKARKTRRPGEPAPMDNDATASIYNLVQSASTLNSDVPGNHELLIVLLLGEVRRILRRGEPEP